ncbi:phosphotransferase family protein [Novosphingobium sp. fls2-241-R2A-195]|uniref:phosphotransferase family protein n=1 Tax=Novosphingobium sp. fls2-241-R2A-195 TaxID=3040296 RepID=UPI00254EA3AE|nr:phosphotransferase family protein [Novosphingobium sp. fls2-241-R2A-195]
MSEAARTQDVLDAVIATGQSSRQSIDSATIERFIAAQPDVAGGVRVSNVRGNSKVGASSGIIVFTANWDSGAALVERDLVLRYSPASENRIFYRYDLARQFRVQRALQGSGLPVPDGLWLDAGGGHLGVPGFIMEMNPGEAPNPSAFAVGPMAEASAQDRALMVDQILGSLVTVHKLDYAARGLGDFAMDAAGTTPMEKCVNWYWDTWDWIQLPEHARMIPVRRWLLENAPVGGETLTHGDSTLHNYMFVGNRLTSMLDWEMSCIGRPESDLALQTLGNELFAAPVESGLPQPPSQAQWLERYEQLGGRKPDDLDYYRRLCAYMIVIAICSLQRAMPEDVRAAQRGFIERLWAVMEG